MKTKYIIIIVGLILIIALLFFEQIRTENKITEIEKELNEYKELNDKGNRISTSAIIRLIDKNFGLGADAGHFIKKDIDSLEEKVESLEIKIETLQNQIDLIFKYLNIKFGLIY